jgi:hypothetical protein
VDALTWADVLRVCGPSLRIQAKLLAQTYHALMNKQLPPKLKLNELKIAKLHGASMQLSTYSTLDPLQMPTALLAALPHFDGRAVDEVVAEVIKQKKLRLTPSVLQKLVDFGILVPLDNSANKFIKP